MKTYLIIFYIFLHLSVIQATSNISFDYARFAYTDTSGLLEIYYNFPASELIMEVEKNKKMPGKLHVFIQNIDTKNILFNSEWKVDIDIEEFSSETQSTGLTGVLSFEIPEGNYSCKVNASLQNSKLLNDSTVFIFSPMIVQKDSLSISDLELATNIVKSDLNSSSVFVKNSYEVIPNPTLLYGSESPVLYFYSEFYNLSGNEQIQELIADYRVYDASYKLCYKKVKRISTKNKSIVFSQAIPIVKFSSGNYQLYLSLENKALNEKVAVYKNFKIYSHSDTTKIIDNTLTEALSSMFGSMSMSELDNAFDQAKYIATKREKSEWKLFQKKGAKRNYLYSFWKNRNKSNSLNSRKYYKRVNYANSNYSTFTKDGWKTDQGRVYILYGKPDEIERHPYEVETKSYEIWKYYRIEGGAYFVFGELYLSSEKTLLHSTKNGETQNINWKQKIYQN